MKTTAINDRLYEQRILKQAQKLQQNRSERKKEKSNKHNNKPETSQ